MIEVHTWEPNANSGKPLFCLCEKGVPFAHRYVDMGRFEQFAPEFLALNPDGTIPALVHDGFVMTESTPAMEYIDDAFAGPPLRPAEPYDRWRMRTVLAEMDNEVAPALAMIASNRLAAPRFAEADPAELEDLLRRIPLPERRAAWRKLMFGETPAGEIAESGHRVRAGIVRFEDLLGASQWLAGEHFSLADIGVFATFYALPLAWPDEASEARTPHLWDWLARCHARPGLQRAFGHSRGFVAGRAAEMRALLGVAGANRVEGA